MEPVPSYNSSPAPEYTSNPLAEEATLEYTPRYPLAHTAVQGNFVQKWKKATLILKDQDEKEEVPCYGRNSVIHGELEVLDENVASVSIKFEGKLSLSVSDVGTSNGVIIRETCNLWKCSDDHPSRRCPSVLPFSMRIPSTFRDGNNEKRIPPSYEATFYGLPALWVTSIYTFTVTITRHRPRYGLWKPSNTYTLRINYRPRSRPNRPIVHCDTIFAMLKYVPEEWHQIVNTISFRPAATLSLEPISCTFLIPSVQTFGLEDTIPFHIQLSGPLQSLAHIFTTSTDNGDTTEPTQQMAIRVCLVRKTLLFIEGRKHWRNRSIGEAKIWATPPRADSTHHQDDDEVSADWEGELRCIPEVRTSSFNIGNVAVQDFLLFALSPPRGRASSMIELQHAHPIKLVTDTWSEDSTTHPQDLL